MAEFWTVTSLKDFSCFGPLWDMKSTPKPDTNLAQKISDLQNKIFDLEDEISDLRNQTQEVDNRTATYFNYQIIDGTNSAFSKVKEKMTFEVIFCDTF